MAISINDIGENQQLGSYTIKCSGVEIEVPLMRIEKKKAYFVEVYHPEQGWQPLPRVYKTDSGAVNNGMAWAKRCCPDLPCRLVKRELTQVDGELVLEDVAYLASAGLNVRNNKPMSPEERISEHLAELQSA